MSLSDPIADMLTRIRNALRAKHETVNAPASGVSEGICRVLKEEGYIRDCKRVEDAKQGMLRIYLKYGPLGQDVVTEIKRVSKPGRRVYLGVNDLPRPLGGLGISIVSTPKGVLSDRQCRQENVGGEVLCTVS
jgi:small subunit ribosomal protein S8